MERELRSGFLLFGGGMMLARFVPAPIIAFMAYYDANKRSVNNSGQ
jgi:hypothetical protein